MPKSKAATRTTLMIRFFMKVPPFLFRNIFLKVMGVEHNMPKI